ncbi:MAG: hypothetical protein HY296_02250 [Thaumarchaeota archaeon]|nr:hypothetical protein [Nitrososphaerota archaeon]
MQPPQGKKVLAASAESVSRVVSEKVAVADAMRTDDVNLHLERVARPKSLSETMRKVGIALVATPDPITGVPGVALIASSFIAKSKEPIGLSHLALETRKLLREIQSLSV